MQLVRSSEGRQYAPAGHTGVVSREIVTATMTANCAAIHVSTMAAGAISDLDVHTASEQTFIVLDGTLQFSDGINEVAAVAGDAVFIAAGDPHAIRNESDSTAICLVVTTPPLS